MSNIIKLDARRSPSFIAHNILASASATCHRRSRCLQEVIDLISEYQTHRTHENAQRKSGGCLVSVMGNLSSTGATPLAILAVARQLSLRRSQFLTMWENLRAFSDKDGFVSRQFFDLSLSRAKITQPVALQIFDLLFTLWDHHAIGEIPAKKFSVGIAPLACSVADIPSVVRLAFHVYDDRGQEKVSPKALHDVLICTYSPCQCDS